jgi:hypothetical protein
MEPCRCGWTGEGVHLCHGGVQMKVGAYRTWGCDACWAAYTARLESESTAAYALRALQDEVARLRVGHTALLDSLEAARARIARVESLIEAWETG